MLIATFNANSIRKRLEIIKKWLKQYDPDVLCVQETKVQDHDFPNQAFTDEGYHCFFKGQKSYNGVAIISKHPFEYTDAGLDSEPADPPRLIRAKVKGVNIVNTYIPQGRSRDTEAFEYKQAWFERLFTFFENTFSPADPVIWTGDFNIAHTEMDVHDPERLWGHVCYCQEIQDRFNRIIEWGFQDLFRMHCDLPDQYSFWDYRAGAALETNSGWRLDYIMGTDPIAKKCVSCWIDIEPRRAETPSDHTFVAAEFDT